MMREVEVRLKGWKLADAMAELRVWLDRNDCVPVNFDISKERRGVLLVRVVFREDHMANTFQQEFAR
jgi:hypothetical protein